MKAPAKSVGLGEVVAKSIGLGSKYLPNQCTPQTDHIYHIDYTDHTYHRDHADHTDHTDPTAAVMRCCAGYVYVEYRSNLGSTYY